MKHQKTLFFILVSIMIAASLAACGGGAAPVEPTKAAEPAKEEAVPAAAAAEPTVAPAEPTAAPAEPQAAAPAANSKFPLPKDAKIVTSSDAMTIASVNMSIDDAMAFYRQYAKDNGLTEYELLTTVVENVFSMAFRVPNQDEELVVQGTKIAADNLTLSLRFEETDVK